MKYPKKLEAGATVGLICPSSAVSAERVTQCRKVIEDMGYKVKMADNLAVNYAGYMADKGDVRGRWINAMFADPEVDAIFCVRGGEASSRAMEYLDLDMIKENPKIFVGYSDVTNLHMAFNQQCGFVTFHGPMVSSNMVDQFDEETRESFFHAISADEAYEFKNPKGYEISVMHGGKAEGILTGGNLTLLSTSLGTPYELDTKGKILFIEEVGEITSRIDRLATQLRNSGKLQECAGILLGQFTDCENKEEPSFDAIACFREILEGIDVPVLYNIQSGHDFPMMTLPMGARCTVDGTQGKIFFGAPTR